MADTHRVDIMQSLGNLALNWPNAKIDENTISYYVNKLEHLPLDLIQMAIMKIEFEDTFWPPIGRILRICADEASNLAGIPTAEEAWEMCLRGIRDGALHPEIYGPITAEHPLVMATIVQLGGWKYVADNAKYIRKQFLETYEKQLSHHHTAIAIPQLTQLRSGLAPISPELLALTTKLSGRSILDRRLLEDKEDVRSES